MHTAPIIVFYLQMSTYYLSIYGLYLALAKKNFRNEWRSLSKVRLKLEDLSENPPESLIFLVQVQKVFSSIQIMISIEEEYLCVFVSA